MHRPGGLADAEGEAIGEVIGVQWPEPLTCALEEWGYTCDRDTRHALCVAVVARAPVGAPIHEVPKVPVAEALDTALSHPYTTFLAASTPAAWKGPMLTFTPSSMSGSQPWGCPSADFQGTSIA